MLYTSIPYLSRIHSLLFHAFAPTSSMCPMRIILAYTSGSSYIPSLIVMQSILTHPLAHSHSFYLPFCTLHSTSHIHLDFIFPPFNSLTQSTPFVYSCPTRALHPAHTQPPYSLICNSHIVIHFTYTHAHNPTPYTYTHALIVCNQSSIPTHGYYLERGICYHSTIEEKSN